MGQTLSEPITTKETFLALTNNYVVGSSCMQGWRVSMEDAHSVILSIPEDRSAAYFGVFDGHGGSSISNYASRHLHKYIVSNPSYIEGDIKGSIEEAFNELDTFMQNDQQLRSELAGSTAVIVLLRDNKLYCANAGDSRAVAFVNNEVIPLSFDHKPTNPAERTRITSAGSYVEFNRINGNLALSRALGDFSYKQNSSKSWKEQAVTCFPDVIERPIDEDWEFIVLACDGIWDVLSSEEVCIFVHERIMNGMKPDAICEELVQCCLAPDGHMGGIGSDNMTVILVIFLKGVSLNYKGSLGENLVDNVVYYLPKDKPEASNDQNQKVDKSD